MLSGPGPFTIFAPTDNALIIYQGTVTNLLNNIPQLTDILKHHVLEIVLCQVCCQIIKL